MIASHRMERPEEENRQRGLTVAQVRGRPRHLIHSASSVVISAIGIGFTKGFSSTITISLNILFHFCSFFYHVSYLRFPCFWRLLPHSKRVQTCLPYLTTPLILSLSLLCFLFLSSLPSDPFSALSRDTPAERLRGLFSRARSWLLYR